MKCSKCGFISFDYLSECKKCRASLTAARDGFGLLAAKPAVPFLLASLLSNYEPPAQSGDTLVEAEKLTTFGFAEGAGNGFRQDKPEIGAEEAASAIAGPDGSEEDFSLIDLSDDELELLVDKEYLGSGGMDAVLEEAEKDTNGTGKPSSGPLSAGEPVASALEISPPDGQTPSAAGPVPGEAIPNLDDFPRGFESEPESAPTLEQVPESIGDPVGLNESPEAPAQFKPESRQARPQPGDSADDFVIELSENDLESLLEELGSTPKGKA